MTKSPAKIEIKLPAIADYIQVARLAISGVSARMDFTIEEIEDIKIALSEACTNVVKHAYPEKDGNIFLTMIVAPENLEIIIKDEGVGFIPGQKINTEPKVGEDQFGLGLGLAFIKSLMTTHEIISEPGKGTVIKMTKQKKG
jgi:serine/threonine-protein kinase RsbW